MRFEPAGIDGAFVIEPDIIPDNRGFFARAFDERDFAARGLETRWRQSNFSWNRLRGTLRGLHYQVAPHQEVKLIACVRGAVQDVILDLRPGSPTRHRWIAAELSEENHRMLYVPEGVAHGFQTLEPETVVAYQISAFYEPSSARGVRFDDPAFAIRWPLPDPVLSERDRAFPPYRA